MAYRGGDLDLRTPRTWSMGAPEVPPPPYEPRARGAYAPGPIWVDEVVLACVNHAYDVALAHRSGEVRLEHLLHALTRIDAAADVLEARGIRVAALRRESATVIASELPVGLTNGKGAPRHSEELEHVLRAASHIASRRNAPASVDDLLHLMLDVEPDLPGLSLLARVNPRLTAAPSYGSSYYADAPREPAPAPAPRASRADYQGPAVDDIQNSRLDAVEQMLRGLKSELGAERKSFGGLLQDLQRDVTGLRSLSGHVDLAPVVERVGTIERSVTAGFEQFSLALASIENDLRANLKGRSAPADLAPLLHRLEIIEEAVLSREGEGTGRDLSDRLDRLEKMLAGERTRSAEAGAALRGEVGLLAQAVETQRSGLASALTPVSDRVVEVRTFLESRQKQAEEALRGLGDRVAAIEQLVSDTLQKVIETQTAGRDELTEIQDAVVKFNANQHTLAGNIEQWRTDGRLGVDAVREDLKAAATTVLSGVTAMTPRVALIESEQQRIGGVLDGLSGTVENMHRVTVERYYRRNRFWYWLFGTDDWVAASWPSQSHRIADELKAVKATQRR